MAQPFKVTYLCTVRVLHKPQLFCFRCMAWPHLTDVKGYIVRLKWEAVSHFGIFNLKLVDPAFYTVVFFTCSIHGFHSPWSQQWTLSNFVLHFGHPLNEDCPVNEHLRKGWFKWFMDITSHRNFIAETWKESNFPEQHPVVFTTAHPPSSFFILLHSWHALQSWQQKQQGILQTTGSSVWLARFISLGRKMNSHVNEDCTLLQGGTLNVWLLLAFESWTLQNSAFHFQ